MSTLPNTIILIGPVGAGKSSVAQQISRKLSLPLFSMDEKRWEYYAEIGYNDEEAAKKLEVEGWWGRYIYWKAFELHALERALGDHQGIIDLGAGHSVYEDETLFARAQRILAPYRFIFLLLPSPDVQESLAILEQRIGKTSVHPNPNKHFLEHPANARLAKFTVFTKGKTVQETANEIMRLATG